MSSVSQPIQAQLDSFAQGLLAILTIWPAYQIALDLCARTDETTEEINLRLAEELLDAFLTSSHQPTQTVPEPMKLTAFLTEFIDVELGVVLEDDSERSVVKDLTELWRTCCSPRGLLEQGTQLVAQYQAMAEKKRSGPARPATRVAGEADGNSSEEDESGSEEEEGDDMEVDRPAAPVSRKPEPVIDEDGFQTVASTRRRHH